MGRVSKCGVLYVAYTRRIACHAMSCTAGIIDLDSHLHRTEQRVVQSSITGLDIKKQIPRTYLARTLQIPPQN